MSEELHELLTKIFDKPSWWDKETTLEIDHRLKQLDEIKELLEDKEIYPYDLGSHIEEILQNSRNDK